MTRYWLTPPELEKYRTGRYDPCPYPRPEGYDALTVPWEKPWYCNAPFSNLKAFLNKAIAEGGPGVFIIPDAGTCFGVAVAARARLEYAGQVRWLEVETKEPWRHKQHVFAAVFE